MWYNILKIVAGATVALATNKRKEKSIRMINLSKYFGIITRCSMMFIGDKLSEYGLAGHHHTYIRAICENPGISQEALARYNDINKSNVARNLTTLEESGYIRRETANYDKRVTLVYPTEKAFEVMSVINQIVNECNTYFLSALNPCEQDEFIRMIGKLELRASEYYNERGDGE